LNAEELFRPCTGCHTVEAGGPHLVGPNLHGIFGRKFGLSEGFAYSDALRGTEQLMTEETLNEWLIDSARVAPGNRMLFPGLRTQEERDAVIAHLMQVTR
jgi:cytochrome c